MDSSATENVSTALQDWSVAVAARDIDRVMSFYAHGDQFQGFDFVPPFMFPTADAFRAEWVTFFALFDEDPRFELRNMTVHVGGDIAVAYGLSHFVGSMHGNKIDIWTRQTNAFKRINGEWKLVHEHVSVPVDLQTMKGVIDFRPEP